MENNFNSRVPTDLDLNGPVHAYTTQPSDVTGNKDASVTFTVAGEATFPGNTGAEMTLEQLLFSGMKLVDLPMD